VVKLTLLATLHRLRQRSRAAQRGSAIFIVLLVITILTAVGTFAMQSAGLNQRSSGYSRQATQTGYVADYGALAALDEMTVLGPDVTRQFINQMMSGTEPCISNMLIDAGGAGIPCYRMSPTDVENRLKTSGNTMTLFDQDGGSLGPGPQYIAGKQPGPPEGQFVVEFTDPVPSSPPAGYDQTGVGTNAYKSTRVTVTAIGQVRPYVTPAQNCTTGEYAYSVQAAGTKTTRARVLLVHP
jgi:hypothetical protein